MSATTRPGNAPSLRHKFHKGRRDRLDAHERLNASQRPLAPGSVDDYVPDEAAQTARAALRKRLIEKVCRPLLAADNAAEETGEDGDNSPKGH